MPTVDFEYKFRNQGLDNKDEVEVRKKILTSQDSGLLLSYIYIYGRSFPQNVDILNKCNHFIVNQIPGLTAVCMTVLIDYWNKYEAYYDVMYKFLDLNLFDTWYDEIIFTVSFIDRRKEDLLFPKNLLDRFEKTISDPRAESLDIL
jgi:hypothetical protein